MNEILFIDARKLGKMVSRRLRVFEDEDLQKIADVYHTWRNKVGEHEDVAGFCKTATIEEVKANSHVLSPGRYVGTEVEEDDGISFEEKMEKLTEELMGQFEEGEKLQKEIKENLFSLGFKN